MCTSAVDNNILMKYDKYLQTLLFQMKLNRNNELQSRTITCRVSVKLNWILLNGQRSIIKLWKNDTFNRIIRPPPLLVLITRKSRLPRGQYTVWSERWQWPAIWTGLMVNLCMMTFQQWLWTETFWLKIPSEMCLRTTFGVLRWQTKTAIKATGHWRF